MNDPSFLAQLDGVRKRAAREKSTVTRLTWRDGRLSAEFTPVKRGKVETHNECDWYYGGECHCNGPKHGPAPRITRGVQERLL